MSDPVALLDTNIIVACFRGDKGVASEISRCEELYLPLVVLAELLCGVQRSRDPERGRQQLGEFASLCHLLAPDAETAEVYAQIDTSLRQAGTPLPVHDVWVAALALQHGLPLATRDIHFRQIPQLKLVSW
ncbi:MAG: type II toxin-antitoxin system VapC family toxin [Verrucomicrobia bacterium]|nr:type II toxin-antitoxin system VapC family toxin [Verrucomicrobiota bacterium]